jgi:hypothetical protein
MQLLGLGDKFQGQVITGIFSDGEHPWIQAESGRVWTGDYVLANLGDIVCGDSNG